MSPHGCAAGLLSEAVVMKSSLVVLQCLPASHLPSVWVGMLLEQLAAALQGECPGCGAVSPQPAGSALCVWSRADHLRA